MELANMKITLKNNCSCFLRIFYFLKSMELSYLLAQIFPKSLLSLSRHL